MPPFNDTRGRTWDVSLSIASVRRIRSKLSVDLLSQDFAGELERTFRDPCLLTDVLFLACEEEARRIGVSDEEFGRSMAADALEGGAQALLGALRDFTPNPTTRAAVGRLVEVVHRLMEQQAKDNSASLNALIDQLEKDAISGATSGTGPA